MIARIQRKLKKILHSIPVVWNVLYLWLFIKNRKKFLRYKVRMLGYSIEFTDPRSFFYEFEFIFRDEIYAFHSDKPNPFIIDGGGYIGLATLYFKRRYPQSDVLVFEPDKTALPMLYRNIKNNRLQGVTVKERGLYSSDEEISFSPNQTDGSKIDGNGEDKIRTEKLSSHITKEVDFLKLNIEGAELEVCRDLDQNKKFKYIKELCIEWHSFAHGGQNLDEVLALLKNNGFRYHISGIRGAARGRFSAEKHNRFFLLIFAKNFNV